MHGFEENTVIDEGVSHGGVRTQIRFEGDEVIVAKQFDAAPHLAHAAHARQSTAGQRWGNGKFIGHIPPLYLAQIMTIRDPQEQKKAIHRFLADNPAFKMFDKA